ncbi:hypothetical protein [Desulfobacter latus]|uniref:Sulfotransferase domain-containing protein n=1 Tax=Desulfobacter latus TaxID=2292 RepID=A0A850SWZ5_9BACT|nr:hypothetical protein [Desulfobacter latus]NWH05669.1 hypothetical protein [Desulfobacter latus]
MILHIGMPKTGTTALQGFFARNQDAFSQKQTIYPASARRANQHYFSAISSSDDPQIFVKSWKDLYKEMESKDWQTMVLSSELFFFHSELEELKEVCDWFCADIHVVLFLRNHIHAVRSIYRTAIKSLPRVCCTADLFTDFLIRKNDSIGIKSKRRNFNYQSIIEDWENTFSKDNVHVISYDEAVKNSNTVEAF